MRARGNDFSWIRSFWISAIFLAAPAYAGEQGVTISSSPAANRAAAAELPPCPEAVPCRADEGDSIAKPDTAPTRSEGHLLPCPRSVPCIATGDERIPQPRAKAHPQAAKRSRPLLSKVTEQNGGDSGGAKLSPAGSVEQGAPDNHGAETSHPSEQVLPAPTTPLQAGAVSPKPT